MCDCGHLLASDRAKLVVSAMCGRDKKVKLEMNDSVRDSGYWLPMDRERAAPSFQILKISPGLSVCTR